MIVIMINHVFLVDSPHYTWYLAPGTDVLYCTDDVLCNAQRTTPPRLTLGYTQDSGLSGINRISVHCFLVNGSCGELERTSTPQNLCLSCATNGIAFVRIARIVTPDIIPKHPRPRRLSHLLVRSRRSMARSKCCLWHPLRAFPCG